MPWAIEGGIPPRRAALQGASRIFVQGGEPQDHEVCAPNDSFKGFFRSL
jgi:hypothetical protein